MLPHPLERLRCHKLGSHSPLAACCNFSSTGRICIGGHSAKDDRHAWADAKYISHFNLRCFSAVEEK